MALSVNHEEAARRLRGLALSTSPETFYADFELAFPGWEANAEPMRGYVGESHEVTIKAAYALQSCLPAPLRTIECDWPRSHGLVQVMAYCVGRTNKELVDLVQGAAERLSTDA